MAFVGRITELPLGTRGFTGTRNPTGVDPGYLTEATNITYQYGLISKEGGAAKYNPTPISGAPTLLGGWDWSTNAFAQRLVIACNDGKLYKDSGALTFPTTLKSGLSASMRPYFVNAGKETASLNRKLFIFTGTDVVQVLSDDGATTSDLATPPTDWASTNQPSFGFVHIGRLWGAGNANDPHRLYYSTVGSHIDFTGAGSGSLSIYPGEGEALVGGLVFGGLIIVWKRPYGIYAIDANDPTATNWTIHRVKSTVGGISPWAFVETEDDVIFVDSVGSIQSLRSTLTNADVDVQSLSNVTELDPYLREHVNFSLLNQIQGVYYGYKREIHFIYADIASSVRNRRLVLDLNRQDTLRFRFSDRDVNTSIWTYRDVNGTPRPMIGDNTGTAWTLDQTARNKNMSGYTSRFTTVPTDLTWVDPAIGAKKKLGAFLELITNPTAFNGCVCQVFWDNKRPQTVTFTPTTSGVPLGSFILGASQLGGTSYTNLRRRITGSGYFLSLSFQNSTVNEDCAIGRVRLFYTVEGD